jgi:histidyl-tRNA synthetase
MKNSTLERIMPYVIVTVGFTPIALLLRELIMSMGFDSTSGLITFVAVILIALIIYHQFHLTLNEWIEKKLSKTAYFRNRMKSDIPDNTAVVDTTEQQGLERKIPVKVRAVVLLELLQQMKLGKAHNDLTKICDLIGFLTDKSSDYIYNELQKGVHFSQRTHKRHIEEVNKILSDLNASISIDINKQY